VRKFSRGAVTFFTLGAFLITLGLCLKFYAYDRLAVVPQDQNSEQVLSDDNATFFDADNVAPGSGPIKTVVRVIGDPTLVQEAADEVGLKARNVAVFDKGLSTDNNGEAPPMDFLSQKFAVDRSSGLAIGWSGDEQNGEPIKFEGILMKFPFGTEKKSYEYWDTTTRAPMTLDFKEETELKATDGTTMKVYKFEGYVPETDFGVREVPRGLFGLEDTGAVEARRTYENTRTVWVEPVTGVIIKLQEAQKQMMYLDEPGATPVMAMDTVSVFTEETVDQNIADYASKSVALNAVKGTAPVVLGILGVLSLLVGTGLAIGFGRKAKANA